MLSPTRFEGSGADAASVALRYYPALTGPPLRGLERIGLADPDQRQALLRVLRRMRLAAQPVQVFTRRFVDSLRTLLVELLPAVKRGVIPGLSLPQRHSRLDRWIASRIEPGPCPTGLAVVDVGCGFPPLATLDLAEAWPNCSIVGIDPGLPGYLVRVGELDAHLTTAGELLYVSSRRGLESVDTADTRRKIMDAFAELSAAPEEDRARTRSWSGQVSTLVEEPARGYERPNLTFERRRLDELGSARADLIRCMNVLPYFTESARRAAVVRMHRALRRGGALVVGTNWMYGSLALFKLYSDRAPAVPVEVAFSVDCMLPLGPLPWFDIHDSPDLTTLARCVGKVRSDARFALEFDDACESIGEAHGFGWTSEGDFEAESGGAAPGAARILLDELDRLHWPERIAARLCKEGIKAWRNEGGYVSMDAATLRL